MTSDRDIYTTANRFIQRFGDAAAAAAELRADEYGKEIKSSANRSGFAS